MRNQARHTNIQVPKVRVFVGSYVLRMRKSFFKFRLTLRCVCVHYEVVWFKDFLTSRKLLEPQICRLSTLVAVLFQLLLANGVSEQLSNGLATVKAKAPSVVETFFWVSQSHTSWLCKRHAQYTTQSTLACAREDLTEVRRSV